MSTVTPENKTITIDRILRNFQLLDSWEEKYRFLIQLGKKISAFPEEFKVEEYRVRGCSSQVWLVRESLLEDKGVVSFKADSDSHIVKGLVAVLMALFNHQTPETILTTDVKNIFTQLGLENQLSANRTNGFYSMVEKMKQIAVEQLTANNKS